MRKSTLLYFLTLTMFFAGHAQSRAIGDDSYRSIDLYDWEDENAFKIGPLPLVQGHGMLSDSLSKAYDGITFYELNGEYYPIRNLADYYYWFTQKFPELFSVAVLEYEYYWMIGDEIGMLRFMSSCENYRLNLLPIPFVLKTIPQFEAFIVDECNSVNVAFADPGSWDMEYEKFHKSLDNQRNGEPVNQGYAETSMSDDIDQMREYVRANKVNGVTSSSAGAQSSGPARIKN